eukprot:TRINITY_DN3531_c0_g1_i1.p1 TRINITY_DN3531_c0_g1~~TRINITY_DN3531_c0_g1_i1.p1  ORF type:complete len:245 (+),score=51.26 TRINITY_DN3531_c0_g1_i1:210-944(+)
MLIVPLFILLGLELVFGLLMLVPLSPIRRFGLASVGFFKGTVGSVAVKTLAIVLSIVLGFSLFSIRRSASQASSTITMVGAARALEDRYELMKDALEAALIAFSLVLGLFVERLHEALKSGDHMKLNIEVLKKQAKGLENEYMRLKKEKEGGDSSNEENGQEAREKSLKARIEELKSENEKIQAELEAKVKEVKTAEASVGAIKKQTDGLRLEFDRLIDENDNLRAQLAVFDRQYSRSEDKKRY